MNAILGYQYIDPRYEAPGYWNKIGNWYNPTNISGPYARVTYNFSNALVGFIGGDYYTARATARSSAASPKAAMSSALRQASSTTSTSMSTWAQPTKALCMTCPRRCRPVAARRPVEQYLTFNAGLNLASNTVLKFAYQILNQQNVGGGFGSFTGGGVNGANLGHDANASVFTTQLAVHF